MNNVEVLASGGSDCTLCENDHVAPSLLLPLLQLLEIKKKISPFLPWTQRGFGILSLSKLEHARSFRGGARIWALGALWGRQSLIAQRPPVIAALSDFNGRMGGWIIWTVRDYGNKGQREKKKAKKKEKKK